jgi:hypothetical protein
MVSVLVGLAIIAFFVVPLFFQLLWNTTVPEIFGLVRITYWQAFRLLLMAGMLFGAGGFIHVNR